MNKIMLQLCYKSKIAKLKEFLFTVLPLCFDIRCLSVKVFILSEVHTKLSDRLVALFWLEIRFLRVEQTAVLNP